MALHGPPACTAVRPIRVSLSSQIRLHVHLRVPAQRRAFYTMALAQGAQERSIPVGAAFACSMHTTQARRGASAGQHTSSSHRCSNHRPVCWGLHTPEAGQPLEHPGSRPSRCDR